MTRFGVMGTRVAPSASTQQEELALRERRQRMRHRCMQVLMVVMAFVYTFRLGQLQIVQAAEHREKQIAQSTEWRPIAAPRGRIMDRHGRVLAAPDELFQVYVAVNELALDRNEVLDAISEVVEVPPDRRAAVETSTNGWTMVAKDVTVEERLELEVAVRRGLHFDSRVSRDLPYGHLARNMLGEIGTDGVGVTGLELALDELLTGIEGQEEMQMDGLGNLFALPGGQVIEPVPGHDVVLTIDSDLQMIAENELQRAITTTKSTGGDIVLLNPRNGEILAIASQRKNASADDVPALTSPYEPGSTMKPFLLSALLEEELADLEEVIDTQGGYLRTGRRVIRDVAKFDSLTVRDFLKESSNVAAAKLSERMEPPIQHKYLRNFGFGIRSRLGYLSESHGRLQRPDKWTSLSPASLAMGYEVSVTSLQLALAYGALANEGVLMQPHLVKQIRHPAGQVVEQSEPAVVRRVVTEETANTVRGVLTEVVQEGTGALAQMAELSVAGKTGTARLATNGGYAYRRYRATFVGFAPADDPRIVVLTRLEDPGGKAYYGGAIAAPTSRAALQAALATNSAQIDPRLVVSTPSVGNWSEMMQPEATDGVAIFASNLLTDSEFGSPEGDGIMDDAIMTALPDLTGLSPRTAAARLHGLGLRVEWHGRGVVVGQTPEPGAALERGGTVILR